MHKSSKNNKTLLKPRHSKVPLCRFIGMQTTAIARKSKLDQHLCREIVQPQLSGTSLHVVLLKLFCVLRRKMPFHAPCWVFLAQTPERHRTTPSQALDPETEQDQELIERSRALERALQAS